MTLDLEDIEAIAQRVAQLLGSAAPEPFIDARDAARRLGVRRAWVYTHARELGGVRLGDGERAPLRFDPAAIRAWIRHRDAEQNARTPDGAASGRRPRARTGAADVSLIPGRRSSAPRRIA